MNTYLSCSGGCFWNEWKSTKTGRYIYPTTISMCRPCLMSHFTPKVSLSYLAQHLFWFPSLLPGPFPLDTNKISCYYNIKSKVCREKKFANGCLRQLVNRRRRRP